MEPNQAPTQSPVEAFTPEPKSYWSIVTLLIVGIVLLALILFLYLQNQKLQKKVINQQVISTIQTPSLTPNTESTTTVPTDEIAGWKTYTNQTYKFSIQYGPELRISSNGDFAADLVDKTKNQQDVVPADIKVRISVDQTKGNFDRIYSAENNSVIPEQQHALDATYTKVKNRTIFGYKAFDYIYDVPGNQTEKSSTMGTVINKNGVFIAISTWNLSTKKFNQILSTFKFTN